MKAAKTKAYGTISAKVIRADGTVEDLGVISKAPVTKALLRRTRSK